MLLAALGQIGVGPAELAGVAVTHIHLDHAGGVGDVARAFPTATVYVHEKGARHLADPTRLIDSAARVYGPLLDSLYGRLDPTPPERLHVLDDGEEIDVGPGRTLTAVDSPGHAKHHLGLHDSISGVLFAGDAVGVKLPDGGVLRPATPPPDFDLDQALTSLRKFAARRPSGIALAHYGLLEQPEELLAEAEETLTLWAETAETAYREGRDIAAALAARFDPLLGDIDPSHKEKLDIMNGVHSNAAGLPPLARRARRRAEVLSRHARAAADSDDELGPELLLTELEVVQGDAALGQVLVQCGELLEQTGLVDVVGRWGVRGASLAAALSSLREMRSSIFALARSFLAWSRCNFPNVERARATVHSFPAEGTTRCCRQGVGPCHCSVRISPVRGPFRPRAEEVGSEPTEPKRRNGLRDRGEGSFSSLTCYFFILLRPGLRGSAHRIGTPGQGLNRPRQSTGQRSGWDLNPRWLAPHNFSRVAPSAARTPLRWESPPEGPALSPGGRSPEVSRRESRTGPILHRQNLEASLRVHHRAR